MGYGILHLREKGEESDDGRLFRFARVTNEPSPIAIILDAKLQQAKPNSQAYPHSVPELRAVKGMGESGMPNIV